MINRTIAATTWAMHARGLTPAGWKVLMIMAHMVNSRRGDFDVWPRQKFLAKQCEMSLSTLKRHITELENKGFLIRAMRMRKDGSGVACCTYTLNVKVQVTLPTGSETYDFSSEKDEDEDDDTGDFGVVQNELPHAPESGMPPQPEDGLPIELMNPEPLKREDSSPPANAGEPLRLFGESELPNEETSLADYVADRWKVIQAANPGIAAIRKIDAGLAHMIAVRAKHHARKGESPLAVWDEALDNIATSRFLRGLVPPGPGRESAFKLTIAWATNATHFRDIIGGKYNNDRDPAVVDTDGRRIGPTEQAVRGAFARFQSGNQRGGEGGNNLRRLN